MANLEYLLSGHAIGLEYIGEPNLDSIPEPVYLRMPHHEELASVDTYAIAPAGMIRENWPAMLILFLISTIMFFLKSPLDNHQLAIGLLIIVISCFGLTRILAFIRLTKKAAPIKATSVPLQLGDGLYYLTRPPSRHGLGCSGIGYVSRGTLYTRHHITEGLPLQVGNQQITPCYVNTKTDNIAYGKAPSWASLADGDKVTVALALCPGSPIAICSSFVTKVSGSVLFYTKSIGCAGSPIFKSVESIVGGKLVVDWKLVGSCGQKHEFNGNQLNGVPSNDSKLERFELDSDAKVDYDVNLEQGQVAQFFAYPGFGKTSQVLPYLVERGLKEFGLVYVSGRSAQNCARIQRLLLQKHTNQVAYFTSNRDEPLEGNKDAKIRVIQHTDLLCKLVGESPVVATRGLWILDSCDFMSSRSLMLRDYLRNRCQATDGGQADALVELAASGYDLGEQMFVSRDESNYAIESITLQPDEMIDKLADVAQTKRCLVFATSGLDRDATSVKNLRSMLTERGVGSVVEYKSKCLDLADWQSGVLLARDTFELEPELTFDAVFDFQKSVRPVRVGRWRVSQKLGNIDRCQYIKRRGCVGRFKPGRYYSPNLALLQYDIYRAEYVDRAVFARAMDNIQVADHPNWNFTELKLTKQQACSWLSSPIRSPYLAKLVFADDGSERHGQDFELQLNDWLETDNVVVKADGSLFRVAFWDEREQTSLIKLARGLNWAEVRARNPSWLRSFTRWASSFSFSLVGSQLK